jgi:hypothetical protein
MRILSIYENGSGQKLNLQKTSIFFFFFFFFFFGWNTSMERRQEILRLSGLSETHRIDTYLGLPSFVGRLKE